MPVSTQISQASLHDLMHYDGRNGMLTWRVNRGRNARAGDEAGTIRPDGMVAVIIEGRNYLAHRLIWLYKTGAFPKGRLKFNDGDPSNLKWANIIEEKATFSESPQARYQRAYRARVRLMQKSL